MDLIIWTSPFFYAAAAAAKSLQSCPTLCDPIDGSPRGSPVPGILIYSVICNWSPEVVTCALPGPGPGPGWVLVTTCWIFVINLLDCIIVVEFASKRFAGVHSSLSLFLSCVCLCVCVCASVHLCTHVSFPTTGPISNGYFYKDYLAFFFFFLRYFDAGHFLKSSLNLLQYCFCFMFWFFGHEAFPWLGIKPEPPALEGEVLTTGPPG